MAVAFDAKMTGGNSADGFNQQAAAATSITSAAGMTVGGSATLLVVVLTFQTDVGGTAPASIGVTWNSVAMTQRVLVTSDGGGGNKVTSAIFTLVSPATGNLSLGASWTNAQDCYMSCASFTGTDTTTGVEVADNTSATQATSLPVTSSSDGATVALFSVDGSVPTVNFNKIFAIAPLGPGGAASYEIGGTTNTHTFTGAGGFRQALAGVHVIAGGGDVEIDPTGYGLTTSLGTPTVAIDNIVVAPSGYGLTTSLGTPSISADTLTISPNGYGLVTSLGTPTLQISGPIIQPTGFGLTISQGTMDVRADTTVFEIPGYELTVGRGNPTVSAAGNITIGAQGYGLVVGFGTPTLTNTAILIQPTGYGLTCSRGTPTTSSVATGGSGGRGKMIGVGVGVGRGH